MRLRLVACLAVLGFAAAEEKKAQLSGTWDALSKEVIPKIASSVHDFGSLVLVARKAGCRVDLSISMNVMTAPATASIRYGWEDANESGTISGNEVETETESVSNSKLAPAVKEIRSGLEAQTVTSVVNVFSSTHVKTVKVEGGYKLQVKPIDNANIRRSLGFDVAYITVDENFLPVQVRAKDDAGGESTAKLRWEKFGDKHLSRGYWRTVTSESSRTEEERTDTYEVRDGIPLLKRVVVDSTISALTSIVTVHTELDFVDWSVEKREKPLPPPGADEAAFEPTKPERKKPDEEEGLFEEKKPEPKTEAPKALFAYRSGIAAGQGRIDAMRFLPGGSLLLAGGEKGPLLLRDAATGKEVRRFAQGGGRDGWFESLDVSPDGKRAVAVLHEEDYEVMDLVRSSILLYDLAGGGDPEEVDTRIPIVLGARFSPAGDRILLCGEKGEVEIVKTDDLAPAATLRVTDNLVATIRAVEAAASADGKRLVATLRDEQADLDLWDLDTAKRIRPLPIATQWVNAIAFGPGARLLAGGALAGPVLLWETARPGEPVLLEGHADRVQELVFAGDLLVSASRDKTLRVWNPAERRCLQTLAEGKGVPTALAASADGLLLAAATDDGTIHLWTRR